MQSSKMRVGARYKVALRNNPNTGHAMSPRQVEAELIKLNTTMKGTREVHFSGRHQFIITAALGGPVGWVGKRVEIAANSVLKEVTTTAAGGTVTRGPLVSTAQKRLATKETKKEQKELKEEMQAITHMLQRFGVTASGSLDQKMLQIDAEDLPKFRRLLIRVLGKQLEL